LLFARYFDLTGLFENAQIWYISSQRQSLAERMKRDDGVKLTRLESLRQLASHVSLYVGLVAYTVIGAKVRLKDTKSGIVEKKNQASFVIVFNVFKSSLLHRF
jgi:hypothetical protein